MYFHQLLKSCRRFSSKILRFNLSTQTVQEQVTTFQRSIDYRINVEKISDRIQPSLVLRKLVDRSLICSSFPDILIDNLAEFDNVQPKVYLGFDPTTDSLHIGNLITLNAALHLFANGFEIYILIGGGTCKLGDPSGRNTDRPAIDWATVKKNSDSIAQQIQNLFANFTKYFLVGKKQKLKPVRFMNNAKWYSDLNVVEFLDEFGRQFRVKHLLEKQAIKSRLSETGLNLNEFLYQILQAYDFLKIYDDHGCLLQLGGTDQIGNVHAGHDLVKKLRAKDAVGIFSPLLTDENGEKLGKSLGNALYLNPHRTSPFHFYQHLFKLHDTLVQKYMYLLTNLPIREIDRICDKHTKIPENREAQKILAEQLTLLVHGETGVRSALKTTEVLFHNKIEHLLTMTSEEINSAFKDIPQIQLKFRPDCTALELALATGHFTTEDEALLWLNRGSFYVNSIKVREPKCIMVRDCHILSNGLSLIKIGKKRDDIYLIRWDYSA
uniref:Tyrosine--tRNA ligase n=1 Tax=Romanomermis culicivorax TaxID=13658 RepID=A0A915K4Q9_ROMCU